MVIFRSLPETPEPRSFQGSRTPIGGRPLTPTKDNPVNGRKALRTLALAMAAGACSDAPHDSLDTDRPLTAEFVEVFRVGDADPPDWGPDQRGPRVTRRAGGLSGLAVDEAAEMSIAIPAISRQIFSCHAGKLECDAVRFGDGGCSSRRTRPPVVTDLLFAHQLGFTL